MDLYSANFSDVACSCYASVGLVNPCYFQQSSLLDNNFCKYDSMAILDRRSTTIDEWNILKIFIISYVGDSESLIVSHI